MMSLEKEILNEISNINAEFAVSAVSKLNAANPLDTGLSRSNWQFSLNSGDTTVLPITTPKSTVSGVLLESRNKDLTMPFYLYNNVEYIVDLAEGSSPQASRGWVDRELQNALNSVYGSS